MIWLRSDAQIILTFRSLICCSEVSIICGSQQTWRLAEPHMQLLPQHRGGCLSWRLVGHLWIPVRSNKVHQCFKITWAHVHRAQVACERIGQQLTHLCTRDHSKNPFIKQKLICLWYGILSPLSLSVFVSLRHTLPASQWEAAAGKNPEWYRETLGDGSPVIIYLHGNTGTRWDESNRIEALELMLMESSDDQRLLLCLSLCIMLTRDCGLE